MKNGLTIKIPLLSFKIMLAIYLLNFTTLVNAQNTFPMKSEWYTRSIANDGNHLPIKRVLEQAQQSKKMTIGIIGGSITAGAAASDFKKTSWGALITQWFKQKFPSIEISFVNAGIGATNSLFGVHRIDEQLLSHKPDLVFIEYSVNDIGEEKAKIAYEGIIRKVLKSEKKPAIVCIGTMNKNGENRQVSHLEVCRHYQIPYISYRDAIYPEIATGNMLWRDLSPDEVHPNDNGHQIICNLISEYLDKINQENDLPTPMTKNRYENSQLFPFSPIENPDWVLTPNGWKTAHKGKTLAFSIKASEISIMYNRTPNKNKAAAVCVSIDGKRRKLNTYFENGWGDWMYPEVLLDTDTPTVHQIVFEYEDRATKEFILHNIQITP